MPTAGGVAAVRGGEGFDGQAAARDGTSLGWRFFAQCFRHGGKQVLSNKRLVEDLDGPQFLGKGEHGTGCGPARHGDDGNLWKVPAKFNDRFQAFLVRHVNVRDHQVCRFAPVLLHALPSVRSEGDLMASRFEGLLEHRPHVRVVVYDEDSHHWIKPQNVHSLNICKEKTLAAEPGELRQKFCYPGGGVKDRKMIRCAKSDCYRGG